MNMEPQMILGVVYAIAVTFLSGHLILKGRMTKRVYLPLLALTALVGFVLSGPFIPLRSIDLLASPLGPLTAVMGLITAFILATSLLYGRSFCAYACPIGAVQELAYRAPVAKLNIERGLAKTFRWAVTVVAVVAAMILSMNVLAYAGVEQFFSLALAPLALVFLVVLLISALAYRPFCRLACPFGAISSILARKSRYHVEKTDRCNECGRCERACPTQEVGSDGSECYLCMRCFESCKKGGLEMRRR